MVELTYEYANSDKNSVLLRFRGVIDEQTICLLVDSGDGVDVDRLLEEDEYLTGILLTHLHADHYATIDQNLRDGAEIYSSETNISVLTTMLREVQKTHNSSFDTEAVTSAATAIEDEITIGGGLTIEPVPAGHTPGATGFYIEFTSNGETETVLVTGDFTRRTVAGYSGLPLKDVDMVFLTAVSSNRFEEDLNSALETTMEQTLAGSPTLITATSLDGVHFAYLLGQLLDRFNRDCTVSIVGQAAKVYEKLGYDVPNVEPYPNYDGPDIIYRNEITISGPSVPTTGGAGLLFDEIKDDPTAALIQLDGDTRANLGNRNCTIHRYRFNNHPTQETIDEFVELTAPQAVVILHQTGADLVAHRDRYNTVVWAPGDAFTTHVLFRNGRWKTPPWVSEYTSARIASRRNETVEIPLPEAEPNPEFERTPVDLTAEGVDVPRLRSRYEDTGRRETKYTVSSSAAEQNAAPDGSLEATRPQETDESPQADSESETRTPDSTVIQDGASDVELEEQITTIKDEIEGLTAQIAERAVAEVTHTDENTLVLRVAAASERFEVGETITLS